MKNLTLIILTLLLVAAIISGFLFHGKYVDMKDTLRVSNQKLSDLNEKVAQLNDENSRLSDQIRDTAQRLKELESASPRTAQLVDEIKVKDETISGLQEKVAQLAEERSRLSDQIRESARKLKELEGVSVRIAHLEDEIKVKDQAFTRLDENIRKLEEGSREERKIGQSLRKELSSKDAMVAVLQEKIQGERSMAKAKMEELKSTYESLVSGLKRQLENKEMTIREFEEQLSITFVDRILFDFGSASITAEGRGILARVGDSLKKIHGMQIRVTGHTDNRPIKKEYKYRFPSNWELSAARAAAVVRFLRAQSGLDPRSFEVAGRSFYRPVASNETKEGRAQNRRVEVIIAPKIEE